MTGGKILDFLTGRSYKQQLRGELHARAVAKFRRDYPDHVWAQMNQVQQHQAWTAWNMHQQAMRKRWTFGRVVGVVVVAFLVLLLILVIL